MNTCHQRRSNKLTWTIKYFHPQRPHLLAEYPPWEILQGTKFQAPETYKWNFVFVKDELTNIHKIYCIRTSVSGNYRAQTSTDIDVEENLPTPATTTYSILPPPQTIPPNHSALSLIQILPKLHRLNAKTNSSDLGKSVRWSNSTKKEFKNSVCTHATMTQTEKKIIEDLLH